MMTAFDCAKYFIKQGLDKERNTFDGNMKLQKLIVFADLISLAECDTPLFDDEVSAFMHGCVVEKVRLRYKNDCDGIVNDSYLFDPDFTQAEYDVLSLTVDLFGKLSARELSDVNHSFDFWKNAYNNSIQCDGFKEKEQSTVSIDAMRAEIGKVRDMVEVFRETQRDNNAVETINGVDFHYSPSDLSLTDEIIDRLYRFSLSADERAYSVYLDDGSLVIF